MICITAGFVEANRLFLQKVSGLVICDAWNAGWDDVLKINEIMLYMICMRMSWCMFMKCYRGMLASGKINPWLLSEICKYSVEKRCCLRINSAGNELKKCIFVAEVMNSVGDWAFVSGEINSSWGMKFTDSPATMNLSWGGYVLFRESWHQCFWILLLCGECMYWWLCSKVDSIPIPAERSNGRVWHFLFFVFVSGITSNCLLFFM